MTVGERIQYIRKFRKMTQQQLGTAIGLPEKGADNRIAQYETNYRVPKKNMLVDMARVLDVNPGNFITYPSGTAEDIMQTFFWLDEDNPEALHFFPIVRSSTKYNSGNSLTAVYDDNDDMPVLSPVGMWFDYSLVNEFLYEWMLHKQELAAEEITYDEYFEWKINWPDTCCFKGFQCRTPGVPKYKWRKTSPDKDYEIRQ